MDVGSGRGWVLWRKCGCRQWEGVGVVEKMWMLAVGEGGCCGENVDVGRGVDVVEKMWMCGYRPWGGSCRENVDVGSGVDDVEKTWMCGCVQ